MMGNVEYEHSQTPAHGANPKLELGHPQKCQPRTQCSGSQMYSAALRTEEKEARLDGLGLDN